MNEPIYQIDLVPQFENGKWVVRESILRDDDEEIGEVIEEFRFETESAADDFIDNWMAENY
jgi:hypothetical protein